MKRPTQGRVSTGKLTLVLVLARIISKLVPFHLSSALGSAIFIQELRLFLVNNLNGILLMESMRGIVSRRASFQLLEVGQGVPIRKPPVKIQGVRCNTQI